ncbi:exosporium protein D [Bacillus toyonensis]|uniref:exosporium protein D n=1 Tax=Bacillus toyonensis TaxID=155322 RepID=UPI000B4417B7|nr:exosporium protein D [Bacillus toyonensis]OTX40639.1 exosporium protein D [Bacillus thuringiensis serovar malayensis]OUB05058.1 exosporium protein D [Bacillus thuringiensis serovar shandongiensis]MBX0352265.1 exosporium protein D [Bacillus toyonensis]MEC2394790.1 exosporium protein D [Bacillus toyonensis]PDZ30269.1 exosporium protein D [Bacillus toyonensis]
MADYFYKDGKKYYKKQSYAHHQKDNCFIETHTITGSNTALNFNVPANTTRTAFEDFTNNHNKTLLDLRIPGTSQPIEVTIRTRSSRLPITVTIVAGETRVFQVEDFHSLTLTNNTNINSNIGIFIQKTFCICCNNQNDSRNKDYKELSYSHCQKENCYIETHSIAGSNTTPTENSPLTIIVPPGASRRVFEDFTNNHNKTLIQISVPSDVSSIEVTIRTRRSSTPIIATLVPDETRVFQVEDFQSLTLTNNTEILDFIDILIQKTFCICCNDKNDSCDEYYRDYECDC